MHLRFLAFPAVAGLALAACGSSDNNTGGGGSTPTATATASPTAAVCQTGSITASGSTALLPLVTKASQAYEAKCPGAVVTVSGGGSSVGLSNVAAGSSDIGDSDVPVTNAKSIDPTTVMDHQVAVVVFAVVVNPQAGVTGLTSKQIQDVFSGKVTNWSAVGGHSVPVTLIERKPGSGTRLSFIKDMLGGTDTESKTPASTQDSTQLVLQGVAAAAGGVSYIGVSSANSSVVPVTIDGVAANGDNVKAGTYKFYAHEHMYTKATAPPLATAFINFMLSEDFQSTTVTQLGYLPVATTTTQSAADQ